MKTENTKDEMVVRRAQELLRRTGLSLVQMEEMGLRRLEIVRGREAAMYRVQDPGVFVVEKLGGDYLMGEVGE